MTTLHNAGESVSNVLINLWDVPTNYHKSVTSNTYSRFVLILPYLYMEKIK